MHAVIEETLKRIERENNIRILYAVESGSRAWGFASPDSDYDVRYVFIRPKADYLRLDPLPETIEGPLDETLDFSGWDIRKTLSLLRKTNPSLMEWAQSPIVYRTTPQWEALAAHFGDYFDPTANMHHYLSMALSTAHSYLKGEQVRFKKYLYALRPLLCCRWLETYGTVPPVPFDRLRSEMLPEELQPVMDALLRRKQTAGESETGPHIPELDAFIASEVPRFRALLSSRDKTVPPSWEGLNELFFQLLNE